MFGPSHYGRYSLKQIRAAMAHDLRIPQEFEERAVTSTIVRSDLDCRGFGSDSGYNPQERAVVNEWFSGQHDPIIPTPTLT